MFTFTSNSVYTTSLIYVLSNNRQNLHTFTCKLLQNAKNYIKIIYAQETIITFVWPYSLFIYVSIYYIHKVFIVNPRYAYSLYSIDCILKDYY